MDKETLIKLIQELYRITLLFPKKEPLRYKMREVSNDILAKFAENSSLPFNKELQILDSYFEVAKTQNWVSPQEILNLQQEYSKIREKLEQRGITETPISVAEIKNQNFPIRQERILDFLRENGRVQVWQLKEIFPEISKRTLRRDFENLLERGEVERIGESNNTFYQLKRVGQA